MRNMPHQHVNINIQLTLIRPFEAQRMRIYCGSCGKKARIFRVEEESPTYAKLYCICLEPHCGHSFVSEFSFSHTLKPSNLKTAGSTIIDRILQLTEEQQRQVLQQLDILT
ncbi:ogr/Delta-like zinc finger family protein [Pseudomonas sp. zjy_15]|uniref:ogr/Delta-like zinc finger family protein n=1 Tax=Pseudomonas sp. zjy_15 TaxID=3367265 RepID=UPI00370ACC31